MQIINVNGQELRWIERLNVATDSIDFSSVKFVFSADWNGYNKTAQFTQDGVTINQLLTGDMCKYPAELVAGDVLVSVFGVKGGEAQRGTTIPLKIIIKPSGYVTDGTTPIPPTPDLYSQLVASFDLATASSAASATSAAESAQATTADVITTTENAGKAAAAAVTAEKAKDVAVTKAGEAGTSSAQSQQALTDLLAMLGTDIATLVGGKIPVSQIPSIATTEIYTVASQAAMAALTVQNGDICIRTDENKSYIYSDGWVYLTSPTDYASRAGYADTAGVAENATMINGHRLVEMTAAEFQNAVKDPTTYYLVG